MIRRCLLPVISAGLVLANAAPGLAQTVLQDRYGPPPAARGGDLQAHASTETYGGPMLSWSGKRVSAAAMAQPAAPARPEPTALARQFAPSTAGPSAPPPGFAPPSAPPMRPAVQPGYEPVLRAPLAPTTDPAPGLLGGPPAAPLPTSIYGQAPSQSQAPAPTFAQASVAARPGGSQLYSLHREYGMTPDAIPAPLPGPNYILVGPPDTPEAMGDGGDPAQGLDRQF
ncbi:MAG: hypothetical protein Q7V15_08995 [Phenylobacterium sp.]|uniref:hypothetical protein n=1 Tax=Phenylobacterium sp. TaxID=1871053 RepID=UPI00271FF896|nr:hypothetical protein [Phenylobacterium sp.]MDO8901477.1 hypothetical protein [Phenylobacterium sp.]